MPDARIISGKERMRRLATIGRWLAVLPLLMALAVAVVGVIALAVGLCLPWIVGEWAWRYWTERTNLDFWDWDPNDPEGD